MSEYNDKFFQHIFFIAFSLAVASAVFFIGYSEGKRNPVDSNIQCAYVVDDQNMTISILRGYLDHYTRIIALQKKEIGRLEIQLKRSNPKKKHLYIIDKKIRED